MTASATMGARPSRAQITLMRALNFDTADLERNQAGLVSDTQRERYAPAKFSPIVLYVIIGHAVAIVGLLGIIALATGESALWLVTLLVLGLGLVPFVLLSNEGNLRPAIRDDVNRGKVAFVDGLALLTMKKGCSVYYELGLGDKTFRVSSKAYGAFRQGQRYRAYYLPHSEVLLTAEPLPDASA